MADLWPDPVPGAPHTSRSLAALQLGLVARQVSDFTRSLVPTGSVVASYDGTVLADTLRLRELLEHLVDAAVVLEREDGTSWQTIADTAAARTHPAHRDRDHQAEQLDPGPSGPEDRTAGADTRYPAPTDPALRSWRRAVERWTVDVERADLPDGDDDGDLLPEVLHEPAADLARELDNWVVRHREPGDPVVGASPVSDAMAKMDPLRELLHLAAQRRRLADLPDTDARAAAAAGLAARAAALDSALDTPIPTQP